MIISARAIRIKWREYVSKDFPPLRKPKSITIFSFMCRFRISLFIIFLFFLRKRKVFISLYTVLSTIKKSWVITGVVLLVVILLVDGVFSLLLIVLMQRRLNSLEF